MNERHCHRCGSELHIESEGALVYCFQCGAPQLLLSEALQEQTAERMRLEREAAEYEQQQPHPARPQNAVDWKLVIKLAWIVSGTLAVLSIVLPPLGLLVFAWAPVVPAIVISLYVARARHSKLSGKLGARIGIVCGSLIVLCLALVNTLVFDGLRFVVHSKDLDSSMNTLLAQVRAQVVAQSGPQAADPLNLLSVPEFRAGAFLVGFALTSALVMLLATGGGALAAAFQKRRSVS